MKRNLLRTGDLSLTLEHPTDTTSYMCIVSNREGNILMKKQVNLWVKVHQVEVEEGAESVLLPFKTTSELPGDAEVEWWDREDKNVHGYDNGSDQLAEHSQLYRNRTNVNADQLKTEDPSLTMMRLTEIDGVEYECEVRKDRELLTWKKVHLRVKECQVEVEEGVESVLLPFTTTPGLPGDAEVEWWDNEDRKVHVYENGSDRPGEQNQLYRNRTKMKRNPLRTGDLSLILTCPTEEDSGDYECEVRKDRELLTWKKVHLRVKGLKTRGGLNDSVTKVNDYEKCSPEDHTCQNLNPAVWTRTRPT
ncbi:uncharacterized protein LOC110367571 [Fundulus heteroclitus]|uniref:uncharacterized protein LOC110367571 n=1 Tax=Fundulus heteroclitus TaxID=8078 RepID=UPI00165CA06D|nr:uncharacterized protein LOC110367571 [Fundulus heteroclitus]